MTYRKQVEKSHYNFGRYMPKRRWCSLWHQLDELRKLEPSNTLEVGPGPGLFKLLASEIGVQVETMDLDPDLNPDYVGSAIDMPFGDEAYDVTCAFQMLEHLPYEHSLKAFREMCRVSRRYVLISLPDARSVWRYKFYIPKLGTNHTLLVPRPQFRAPLHVFNGEHYWEIGKRGYPLSKITSDLSKSARLCKTYRVPEYTYHRFFLFEK